MKRQYFLLVFFALNVLLTNGQMNVALRIDQVLPDSWMEFEIPTINNIQVKVLTMS